LEVIKKSCIVSPARNELQEDLMAYEVIRDGNYPGTDLPVFKVFDADEYNDASVKHPRPIGEVWSTGEPGVTGQSVPTGVRWQLSGSFDVSPLYPVGAYGEAARAMIAAYEENLLAGEPLT
jgi:hypothetical protein